MRALAVRAHRADRAASPPLGPPVRAVRANGDGGTVRLEGEGEGRHRDSLVARAILPRRGLVVKEPIAQAERPAPSRTAQPAVGRPTPPLRLDGPEPSCGMLIVATRRNTNAAPQDCDS